MCGCLTGIVLAIVAIICWVLGWLSWAIFKIVNLCLILLELLTCLFCATPPDPTPEVPQNSDTKYVITQELRAAAEKGDVGSQYVLAKHYYELAEKDSFVRGIGSAVMDVPEKWMMDDSAHTAAENAEFWYGKVADQGYLCARIVLWELVSERWERNVEQWLWIGEKGSEAYRESR